MAMDTAETVLEADLSICDAHHHLWVRPAGRYLLNDFLDDVGTGHKIVSTVAIECGYSYCTERPDHLKPIGETELLDSVAAQVAADATLGTRVAAAIVRT